jgi:pimeloyl-ACP methyl ester carboxylesterase
MNIERGLVNTDMGYIHYRAAGHGAPVMLFHINQQSSALMLELIQALAPAFRVVAMDYPSHGSSDHVTEQPNFADYARCGIAAMDALGIARSAVLGEAVGAGVCVEIANTYPDRVTKVVLVNCPFSPERDRTATHVRELQSGLRPADPSGFPLTALLNSCWRKIPPIRRCSLRSPGWIGSTPRRWRSAAIAGKP